MNSAAQVLSHSVAAGISALVTLKHLPDRVKDTAQFVEHFDGLFNTFKGQTVKTSQRLGHAFSDKSGHLSFLKESLEFLDKVKTSHGVEFPCIFGWKLCNQSLLGLWENLKMEQSFWFILTSQVNQDCVENLFSIIHGFGGHRDNPDVEQFKSSFKYVVADKLFVQSDASNCQVDNDKILLDVSNIAMAKYVWSVPTSVEKHTGVDIAVIALPPLSNATLNVAVYMAGYLLLKYLYLIVMNVQSNEYYQGFQEMSFYTFVHEKTYKEGGSLVLPTFTMANFVEHLETMFCAVFEAIIHMSFVLDRLYKSAEEYCKFLSCKQEMCSVRIRSMVKLYMKVRIHHALKMSNMNNSENKSGKYNRKMLKLSHF